MTSGRVADRRLAVRDASFAGSVKNQAGGSSDLGGLWTLGACAAAGRAIGLSPLEQRAGVCRSRPRPLPCLGTLARAPRIARALLTGAQG